MHYHCSEEEEEKERNCEYVERLSEGDAQALVMRAGFGHRLEYSAHEELLTNTIAGIAKFHRSNVSYCSCFPTFNVNNHRLN